MVHCGYEGTAVEDTVRRPLKALKVALGGIETEAPMAPEIPLNGQRPAEFSFEDFVAEAMAAPANRDQGPPDTSSGRAAE